MVWGFPSLAVCWSLIRPQMIFFLSLALRFFRWICAASSLHLFSVQGACLSQFGDFRHSWSCSLCYSSGGTQRPQSQCLCEWYDLAWQRAVITRKKNWWLTIVCVWMRKKQLHSWAHLHTAAAALFFSPEVLSLQRLCCCEPTVVASRWSFFKYQFAREETKIDLVALRMLRWIQDDRRLSYPLPGTPCPTSNSSLNQGICRALMQ